MSPLPSLVLLPSLALLLWLALLLLPLQPLLLVVLLPMRLRDRLLQVRPVTSGEFAQAQVPALQSLGSLWRLHGVAL